VTAETTPVGKWSYWSVGEKAHGMLEDADVAGDAHFPAPGSLKSPSNSFEPENESIPGL